MNSLKNKIFVSVVVLAASFVFCERVDAAVLRMKPAQTEVTVGNIVNVQVTVDTLDKVINNAESVIQFPTDLLEVVSINNSPSVFSLWVENPSFSNGAGQASFNGGVPNPGFQGSNGAVISIVFRAKKAGTASVIFSNSAVRENDGLGTDILSDKIGSEITIRSSQAQPTAPTIVAKGLRITSLTHPKQDAWYNNDTPTLMWELPTGAEEVRTLVGKNALGQPSVRYTPAISDKTIEDLSDGTYYFSVQVRTAGGWSNVSRYQLNIDTIAPEVFTVEVAPDAAGTPVARFSTTDTLSGIDHYELLVNGDNVAAVRPDEAAGPVVVPPTAAGQSTLTVVAYDKAGNTAFAEAPYLAVGRAETTVVSKETFTFALSIPYDTIMAIAWMFVNYLSILLIIVGVVGAVVFVGWYIWHRVHRVRRTLIRRIAATDKVLHAELIEIHKALKDEVERLKTEGAARELTTEEKRILKQFSKLVEKTRHTMAEEFSRER